MQAEMYLKVLLPNKIFLVQEKVQRITAETKEGSFGILPNRLDCVAALVPGIMSYVVSSGEKFYVAVDEGMLMKTEGQVLISVRNAIRGTDLNKLKDSVETEFKQLDKNEKEVREVLAKLESGFIRSFERFRRT